MAARTGVTACGESGGAEPAERMKEAAMRSNGSLEAGSDESSGDDGGLCGGRKRNCC